MERRSLLCVFSGLVVVYLAARASSQDFRDPTKFYKNMTFEFDVRHRGEVGIPRCVKDLMNCWDVMRAETVCGDDELYLESACMLMRSRACNEFAPFGDKNYYLGHTFKLFDRYCPYNNNPYNTRRWLLYAGPSGERGAP